MSKNLRNPMTYLIIIILAFMGWFLIKPSALKKKINHRLPAQSLSLSFSSIAKCSNIFEDLGYNMKDIKLYKRFKEYRPYYNSKKTYGLEEEAVLDYEISDYKIYKLIREVLENEGIHSELIKPDSMFMMISYLDNNKAYKINRRENKSAS